MTKFKLGRRVIDVRRNPGAVGIIISTDYNTSYPIRVEYEGGRTETYSTCGKYEHSDSVHTIEALPRKKAIALVLVNNELFVETKKKLVKVKKVLEVRHNGILTDVGDFKLADAIQKYKAVYNDRY